MVRSWGWVGQFGIAILLALLLGAILGSLPLFAASIIAGTKLRASHMVQFMGYAGALLLFWRLGRRAAVELPEDGKGLSFLRHVITPLVTLIVVSAAYNVILMVIGPFLDKTVKPIYNWIFIIGIVGSALWLTVACLLHSAPLMASFQTLGRVGQGAVQLPGVPCPQCGRAVAIDMQFCGRCGAPVAHSQGTPKTAAQRW